MKEELFGGKDSEMYNALYNAFLECANDEDKDFYTWIEDTPKTTMTVFLVDKLKENGFKIIKS